LLNAADTWVPESYPVESVEEMADGRLKVVLVANERAWLERLLLRLGPTASLADGDPTVGPAFLVSTPRADRTTRDPDNPFHELELSRADFEALLRRFFGEVELYGQRRLQTGRHRLLQRVDVLGLRGRLTFLRPASRLLGTPPMAEVTSDGIVISRDGLDRAIELVAVRTADVRPAPSFELPATDVVRVAGPAVVELPGATCWLPPGWVGARDGRMLRLTRQ
jgi:hypothetical protein